MFLANDSTQITAPHVFETIARAFHFMIQFQQNQSIIVSGESGSGKTRSVKLIMDWLQHIQQNNKPQSKNNSSQIFGAPNQILEAFGNAKV